MNRIINIFFFVVISSYGLQAQELNFRVVVNDQRASTQDKRVFRDMENAFTQFLNSRKWSNNEFQPEERIEANLVITIEKMIGASVFEASALIQASRPIYGTGYQSLTLNFADRDWIFEYTIGAPLDFALNNFNSNISSMLAYYAFIVLGVDYDSFSELGGNQYFLNAQQVVNVAQGQDFKGWNATENRRNRYWLAELYNNNQLEPLRKGNYTYHRIALDQFQEDPDNARKLVLDLLKEYQEAEKVRPNNILRISFFDAESDELINIFKEGDLTVRKQAYDILVYLNPRETDKYDTIIKN